MKMVPPRFSPEHAADIAGAQTELRLVDGQAAARLLRYVEAGQGLDVAWLDLVTIDDDDIEGIPFGREELDGVALSRVEDLDNHARVAFAEAILWQINREAGACVLLDHFRLLRSRG